MWKGTTMRIEDEMKRTEGRAYTGTYAGKLRWLARDQSVRGMSPKCAVLFILPYTVAAAHSSLRSRECVFLKLSLYCLRAERYGWWWTFFTLIACAIVGSTASTAIVKDRRPWRPCTIDGFSTLNDTLIKMEIHLPLTLELNHTSDTPEDRVNGTSWFDEGWRALCESSYFSQNIMLTISKSLHIPEWARRCLWHINVKTVTYSNSQGLPMSRQINATFTTILQIRLKF